MMESEQPSQGSPVDSLALSQSDIDEFKDIVRRTRGIELDNREAWNQVTELMNLFGLVHRPLLEEPRVLTSSHLPPGAIS